jgi:hypothetical protein
MQFKRFLVFTFLIFPLLKIQAQSGPNWSEHVAPIIYKSCTPCHSAGGIAPFALSNYNEVKYLGDAVVSATQAKRMPPFPASLEKNRYAHENVLSAYEIDVIKRWNENNHPQGDTSKEPKKPVQNSKSDLPRVDATYKMTPYLVKTNDDVYRCFAIPSNLFIDKMIKGMEVVPGNRKIVHHVLIFQDTSQKPLQLDNADPEPGYSAFGSTGSATSVLMGMYVPGQSPFIYPLDFAARLKKNSVIVIQIHYPPGINQIWDSTKLNLMLEDPKSQREVFVQAPLNFSNNSLINGPLYIEANTIKSFSNRFVMPAKISLLAVAPHMHLLGDSIKSFLVNSGDTTDIIDIPKWDFHWQMAYKFRKPIVSPKGSVLWGKATYDNTYANPHNPNMPPRDVAAGEGTADEMFLIYYWYTLYKTGDENLELDTTPLKMLNVSGINKNKIVAYPNPSTNEIRVINLPYRSNIRVYNSVGNLMYGDNVISPTISINIQDWPVGVYIIHSAGSQGDSIFRFIKN